MESKRIIKDGSDRVESWLKKNRIRGRTGSSREMNEVDS